MEIEDDEHIRHGIPEATILLIFGASGDLTRRKLMPALYHLARENLLPGKFKILGLGRRIQETPHFIRHMKHRVIQYCTHKMEARYWLNMADNMESIKADYHHDITYRLISEKIAEIESIWEESANLLIYLATNPSHFEVIVENLAIHGLNKQIDEKWNRLIIEKPFGLSENDAIQLNTIISKHYAENQIYRIDHFLGKEAIQNILIFRLYNIMFQPLWNKNYIDHIQILNSETIGVEGRVDFFEQTGVIRDMVQSHILQILAFLTMELPNKLDPEIVRDRKVELLNSIRIYKSETEIIENCLRGQYEQGVVNSELVKKYRDEPGVPENSNIETFAALRLFIDNEKWEGVPIYIRTGKRMPKRKTEIFIQLKDAPFPSSKTSNKRIMNKNSIRLEIQPEAGIEINIGWKPPGILTDVEPIQLDIGGEANVKEPKAYERLIVDAMRGDSTLFIRMDEILAMWRIVDPIVSYWKKVPEEFPNYFAGTKGPRQTKEFIQRDNREWSSI